LSSRESNNMLLNNHTPSQPAKKQSLHKFRQPL